MSGVDLYVLDSGVFGQDLNVVEEMDFVTEAVTDEGRRHGFHVSGIVGAIKNQSGISGVAPGARIHSFRVLDNSGTARASDIIQALDVIISRKYANPQQPMVINMSFGADTGETTFNVLDQTVIAAIDAGITVVVSAGNEAINVETVTPARVPDAITVGSFGQSNTFSSFSNYGALVDILAPVREYPVVGRC